MEKTKSIYKLRKSDFKKQIEIAVTYQNIIFYITYSQDKNEYMYFAPLLKIAGSTFSIINMIKEIKFKLNYEAALI